MTSFNNFGIIVNGKGKDCCLPLVKLAKFPNFGIIEEENIVEYRECNTNKIYHYHTVVGKRLRPNILY